MIRLGYAGMNTLLPSPSRTFRLARYTEPLMIAVAEGDLRATLNILMWNESHRIKVFRISSAVIPFGSHPVNGGRWKEELSGLLSEIGGYAKDRKMRLSMHPGQYTVLNTPDERILSSALSDLDYHSSLLGLMGLSCDARIVIHCGGMYGNKDKAIGRLHERCSALPEEVRCRIALENDEKVCGASDILEICEETGLPGVFDLFHDRLLPTMPGSSPRQIIEAFKDTWPKGERQKIHYSNQHPGKSRGAHSEHIDVGAFLQFYETICDIDLDVMLETKDKEQSALAIMSALGMGVETGLGMGM